MKNEKMELEKKGSTSDWISNGLLKFSHHMLYQPSTLALVGEIDLVSIEKDFILFDQKFHYFGVPMPRWIQSWVLSREVQARTNLAEIWLKNPNPPKASEFHLDQLAVCNSHSQWLSDQDRGLFLTGFLWASLGNTIPAVFWSLFYILRDTKALETIKQELDTHLPAVPLDSDVNDSSTEDWTPEQLDACIYLESAINEILRLVGTILMTRTCLRQTEIKLEDGRTVTVKPNETLAWFSGISHHDEKIFPQADEFIFDRFLNKKVDNIPGYMPFGGGKSICPGRFFAKYEIKMCVALLLRYMEYKLEDATTVPAQLQARIGFGIAPPIQDVPILYRYKT